MIDFIRERILLVLGFLLDNIRGVQSEPKSGIDKKAMVLGYLEEQFDKLTKGVWWPFKATFKRFLFELADDVIDLLVDAVKNGWQSPETVAALQAEIDAAIKDKQDQLAADQRYIIKSQIESLESFGKESKEKDNG